MTLTIYFNNWYNNIAKIRLKISSSIERLIDYFKEQLMNIELT